MSKGFIDAHREKILELDVFLQKNQYFSSDCLPGVADGLMFSIFDRESKLSFIFRTRSAKIPFSLPLVCQYQAICTRGD